MELQAEHNPLFNVEAEAASLGSMLISPDDAIPVVSAILNATDYHLDRNQWIYEALLALDARKEPITTISIFDELERRGKMREMDPSYLMDLMNAVPTHVYAQRYALVVKDRSNRRAAVALAGELAKAAYDLERPIEQTLAEAEAGFTKLTESNVTEEHTHTMGELVTREVQRIDEAGQRIAAGLPATDDLYSGWNIDRFFGGWEKTRFYILAGRPGMGKSAAGFGLALEFAKRGYAGIAFSCEMTADQITRRYLAQRTALPVNHLKGGDLDEGEWLVLLEGSNALQTLPIKINDTPSMTLRTIRTNARRENRRLQREGKKLDWIVIDYIQLVTAEGKFANRNEEVAYISRSLKQLGRELSCVIIGLAQLSRAVEGRADKRPTLADLRESGALEQDADVVDFLYREDYYDPETDRANILDWIRAKSRDGATGTTSLYFRPDLTQVRDLEIQRTELEY